MFFHCNYAAFHLRNIVRYWIYWNDLVQGPFELDELVSLHAFSEDLEVCMEGRDDWLPASRVADLAPSIELLRVRRAPAPPPPPPPSHPPSQTPLQGELFGDAPGQQKLFPGSEGDLKGPFAYAPVFSEADAWVDSGRATNPFKFFARPSTVMPTPSTTSVLELPPPPTAPPPLRQRPEIQRPPSRVSPSIPPVMIREQLAENLLAPQEQPAATPVDLKRSQRIPLTIVSEPPHPAEDNVYDEALFDRESKLLPWLVVVTLAIFFLAFSSYTLIDHLSSRSAIAETKRFDLLSRPFSIPRRAYRASHRWASSTYVLMHRPWTRAKPPPSAATPAPAHPAPTNAAPRMLPGEMAPLPLPASTPKVEAPHAASSRVSKSPRPLHAATPHHTAKKEPTPSETAAVVAPLPGVAATPAASIPTLKPSENDPALQLRGSPQAPDPWMNRQAEAIKFVMEHKVKGAPRSIGDQGKLILEDLHEKDLLHAAETGERLYLPDKIAWLSLREEGPRYRVYLNFSSLQANGERAEARSYQFIADLAKRQVSSDDATTTREFLNVPTLLVHHHSAMADDIESLLGGVDALNKQKMNSIIVQQDKHNKDELKKIQEHVQKATDRLNRAIVYFRTRYPEKTLQNVAKAFSFLKLVNAHG